MTTLKNNNAPARSDALTDSSNPKSVEGLKTPRQQLLEQIALEQERIGKARKTAIALTDMTRDELFQVKQENNESWIQQIKRRGLGDWLVGKTVGEGEYREALENSASVNHRQRLEHELYVRDKSLEMETQLREARFAVETHNLGRAKQLLKQVASTDLKFNPKQGEKERKQASAQLSSANEGRISTAENWETGLKIADSVGTIAAIGTGVGGASRVAGGLILKATASAGSTLAIESAHDLAKEATSTVVDIASGQEAGSRLNQATESLLEATKDNITTAALTGIGVGVAGKLSAGLAQNQAILAATARGSAGAIQSAGQETKKQVAHNDYNITKIAAHGALGFTAGAVGGSPTAGGVIAQEAKNLLVAGGTAIVGTALNTDLKGEGVSRQLVEHVATSYLATKTGAALQNMPLRAHSSPPPTTTNTHSASARQAVARKPRATNRPATTNPTTARQTQTPSGTHVGQTTAQTIAASSQAPTAARAATPGSRTTAQAPTPNSRTTDRTEARPEEAAASRSEVTSRLQTRLQELETRSKVEHRNQPAHPSESNQLPKKDIDLVFAEHARAKALAAREDFQRTHPELPKDQLEAGMKEVSSKVFAREYQKLSEAHKAFNSPAKPLEQPTKKEGDLSPEALEKLYFKKVEETAHEVAQSSAATAIQHLNTLSQNGTVIAKASAYRRPSEIEVAKKQAYESAYDNELRRQGIAPRFNPTALEQQAMNQASDASIRNFNRNLIDGNKSTSQMEGEARRTYRDAYRKELDEGARRQAQQISRRWLASQTQSEATKNTTNADLNQRAQKLEQLAYTRIKDGSDTRARQDNSLSEPTSRIKINEQVQDKVRDIVARESSRDYLYRQLTDKAPNQVSHADALSSIVRPYRGASAETWAEYRGKLAALAVEQRALRINQTPEARAEEAALRRVVKEK